MKTVLIIEDDTRLNSILNKKLSESGFIALTAFNGKEGLEQIKKSNVDFIILDLMMPEMDGQTFYYYLRNQLKRTTPVIVLTNMTAIEIPNGVLETVIKTDVSLEEIVIKINKYFNG